MSLKKVAISQSNYIPWKGYFNSIKTVDEFVLYDDMQYTKRDWRNRNKIKTPHGLKWLSIPVEVKGKYYQKINETKISDKSWNTKHLNILKNNYAKAKCYNDVIYFIEELYCTATQNYLSEINYHFLYKICNFLEIDTKISFSGDYKLLKEGKTEKLVDLCLQLKAFEYYTGSAAKNYMDESLFERENIEVFYFDYSNYPEYSQLYGKFEHQVSILDLIFNEGTDSPKYITTV
ncbi:MAG: WbqC family protein [Flavobacteriaceae bacterium]